MQVSMAAEVYNTDADTVYWTYPLSLIFAAEHIWYWRKGIKCVPMRFVIAVENSDFEEAFAIVDRDWETVSASVL